MALYRALLIIIISPRCSSQFIEGSSVLPRADDSMAIGYDANTDTILLIGGKDNPRQFVTFKDHNFNDISATYLTKEQQTYGRSQHFTQINDELWIIRDEGAGFITMNTTTYTVDIPSITIPIKVDSSGCLTSVPGYLIVIGGGWPEYIATPQIYRFSDNQWLSNVPSLAAGIIRISCVVVNDILYVIGGRGGYTSGGVYYDTIQYLDISNMNQISTQSWQTLSGKLATARSETRSVVDGTDIYVIGGDPGDGSRCNDVNVIDTLTGSVTVPSDNYLPNGASNAASIIVNNTLYVFGGWIANKYSYKLLTSSDPIKAATAFPTEILKNQTSDPTTFPTVNATISLTKDPSESSTNNPTTFPTKNPITSTTNPTQNPSKYPPQSSTYNPIEHPNTTPFHFTNDPILDESTYSIQYTDDSQKQTYHYWILSFSVVLCIILCCICVVCLRRKIAAEYDGVDRIAKYIQKSSKQIHPMKLQEELPKANDSIALQRVASVEYNGTIGNTDDTMKTDMDVGEGDWEFNPKDKEGINQVPNVLPIHFVNAAEMDGVVMGDDETTIGANTTKQ